MRLRAPRWGFGVVCACAVATSAGAATLSVAAGGDLQAAIDAAQPGDVIALEPGATFVGNFVLPNKGVLDAYITIRSAAPDSTLPPAAVRMTPAYAALLPKIKSPNSTSALRTAAAANHWQLQFLEFQANQNGYGDVIELGTGDASQNDLSLVPYALTLDRVYVHGDPAMGQKRGIALNSRDTAILNSYISDCKAVGQDSQAIGGFNGPGNYLIENNYLEASTENFILGGSDPAIPNLVTSNVTFRHNYLTKPLAWRDAIAPAPTGTAAVPVPGGGSLSAGTYAYRVVVRLAAGQTNKAVSEPSAEVAATVSDGGAVTISWSPVAGALDYLVYGRAAGAENMYWKTTDPYFSDTGAAGTGGAPGKPTRWAVKNLFELKNAQDVVVEGNVMENLWIADQSGYPVVFTPRNQGGHAPWAVVQRVSFRHNLVRHTAGGVNILGYDNLSPSQQTNHITVADNVFDDLDKATWGTGSRFLLLGSGAASITIDHNTVVTSQSAIVGLYGGSASSPQPMMQVAYTNNMSLHNSYGIIGDNFGVGLSSIDAYLPDGIVDRNVLAAGPARSYPAGNFFPSPAEWQADFADYAAGDYRLQRTSLFKGAGTDGRDLGADIDALEGEVANALTGDNRADPGVSRVQILTTGLPDAVVGQAYAQALACTGGTPGCGWQVVAGALPQGLALDGAAGVISGTPATPGVEQVSIEAYDLGSPQNAAVASFALTVDAPPLVVSIPPAPGGQVGVPYQLAASVTGAVGSVTWSIASGTLPPGLGLDTAAGVVSGIPTGAGTFTALLEATDAWGSGRSDAEPLTVAVAPAPLGIVATTLPSGTVQAPYSAELTAIGGTGTTTWSVVAGSLPPGLALDASGLLSGTPTTAGSATFTVRATDAGWPSNVDTREFTIAVAAPEVVLWPALDATVVAGTWSVVPDAGAAGGLRLSNPDSGAKKLPTPLSSPSNYFEVSFVAQAGIPYHLWVRGRAENDYWDNDSVYAQFSGTVNAHGKAVFRIGTKSGTSVILEDGLNAGLSGWGWTDNAYGSLADPLYFETSGPQTIRVQVRADGLSIDQIVLSSGAYLNTPPGATTDDTTILQRVNGDTPVAPAGAAPPALTASREIVLRPGTDASPIAGTWAIVADDAAAGGMRIWNPDLGAAKLGTPIANPANYFEGTFQAEAGVPYHLWMRGKADRDYWGNDSVYAQFSQSVDGTGAPVARIGTTSAAAVIIEDGSGAGLSGWGWADDSYGALAAPIYFATSGPQTIRVQVREDGLSIDQIVLSADTYVTSPPGATKQDTTILAR